MGVEVISAYSLGAYQIFVMFNDGYSFHQAEYDWLGE